MTLVGLKVKGVPEIAVQEAIWLAVDVMRA
jgi:hypothetical protein